MSKIQIRRGTTAEWAAANPTLASGEPGLDTTTGTLKIGDGITAWLSLSTPGRRDIVGLADGTGTAYTNATSSETDITVSAGAAPTLTLALLTTRRYKAVFVCRWQSTVDADIIQVRFIENAVARKGALMRLVATTNLTFQCEWVFTPASGASVVYKVTGARTNGTGTISAFASAQSPMQFWIEDMGLI